MSKRAAAATLACVLALAVAIPSAAVALPKGVFGGLAAPQLSIGSVARAVGRRLAALEARIAGVLQRRDTRFDAASGRLTAHITRVRTLADKVAASGGDVSSARALLDSASQHLGRASDLEAQAVAAFQAVPRVADRRSAFAAARAIGRSAGSELAQSRADLRSSIVELRSVVRALKSSANLPTGTN